MCIGIEQDFAEMEFVCNERSLKYLRERLRLLDEHGGVMDTRKLWFEELEDRYVIEQSTNSLSSLTVQ